MGLLRKTISVSSLGGAVSYRSKAEREERDRKIIRKEAQKQTKLLREIARREER